jgi:peroxiredoxin
MKIMRPILAALLCAAALYAVDPGQRAPGFALMNAQGDVVDLYDFRGKPVIIEFMQTTCPHCANFAVVLGKVQAKFGDRVRIIAIANPPDNPNSVARFIAGHGITYPIVFDSGQAAYSYMKVMKFDLPQVFLVDADGIVFNRYGYSALTKDVFEGDGLLNEIDRLFASSRPKPPSPAKSGAKKK